MNKHSFNLCSKLLNKMLSGSLFWVFLLVLTTFGIYGLESKYYNHVSLYHYESQTVSAPVSGQPRKLPIYCVETSQPKIAISFDCAWGNESTKTILDILEKQNVKATFFMTGGWVKQYPDDVMAIAQAGHDLGNHSENHKHMSELNPSQCEDEIMTVHNKVKELTGMDMCLFRPPYGDYNNTVISVCDSLNYHAIQWNVDSLDWKDYGADSIIQTVTGHKALSNGSIILLHNGSKYTPEALDALISKLKEMGYEFVPISQLIYYSNYIIDVQGRQKLN